MGFCGLQRAMNEGVPLVESFPNRRTNSSFRSKCNVFLMNPLLSKFYRNDLSQEPGFQTKAGKMTYRRITMAKMNHQKRIVAPETM